MTHFYDFMPGKFAGAHMNMRMVLAIIFLIPICIAYAGTEGAQSESQPGCVRVLDINVWSGLDYKGYLAMGEYETAERRETRFQALCSQIRNLNPDIIGINEANKLPEYAERLARETGYEPFYHVGVGGIRLGPVGLPWNLREGDVILVKKSLNPEYVGRKQLSGGPVGNFAAFHFSDATQIVAVKVRLHDQPFYVFVTHWHSSLPNSEAVLASIAQMHNAGEMTDEERRDILARIQEGVDWRLSEAGKTIAFVTETAKDAPYILVGDFNAEAGSQEIQTLLHRGMVDVYQTANPEAPGFTWDPITNANYKTYYVNDARSQNAFAAYAKLEYFSGAISRRIDYIFLGPSSLLESKKIAIGSSSVAINEIVQGVHASDHYGVVADILIYQ